MMTHEKLIKLLKNYGEISKEDEIDIAAKFIFQKTKKKEILVGQNSSCNKLFFVIEGFIRAYSINDKGNEVTRMIAWEGNFLTDIVGFRDQNINQEIIESLTDSFLLFITKNNFDSLLNSSENFKKIYIKVLEEYSNMHMKKLQLINIVDISLKMKYFKEHFPDLVFKLNDKILASFLSISRETLVRHKKIW
ncbi:Crp/Fnr family transcriptional regulator [Chryseobacterium sp. OV279]|uniref:Crp/Fnr family transcriptional regulator n=1 Tax=Chryseobacterium sp. OV279 TaxID=1500285 RepID=UPI000647416C|nr:cyclic nucleotide-binding domain-containing protein [Chryseobacterium sp. OV279]